MKTIFSIFATIWVIIFLVVVGTMLSNLNNPDFSFGVNGVTETRCQAGFKFIINQNGGVTQVLDSYGKGIPCEKK